MKIVIFNLKKPYIEFDKFKSTISQIFNEEINQQIPNDFYSRTTHSSLIMCASGKAFSSIPFSSFNLDCASAESLDSSGSGSGTSRNTATMPFGWTPFERSSETSYVSKKFYMCRKNIIAK